MMSKYLLGIAVAMLCCPLAAAAQDCSGFELNASGDSLLCLPGGPVPLSISPSLPLRSVAWSPATGLDAADAPAVQASPLATTTYTVTALGLGGNLVANGHFEQGNQGFTTDYANATGGPNGPLSNPGQYQIDDNPTNTHQNFASCGDHTSGSGQMMVVNGATQANRRIWCQTVSVQPNTDYAFSAWVTSVVPENPPQLRFSFNGQQLGNLLNVSLSTCDWQQFSQDWNSGMATSVDICIFNNNLVNSGNDFALDDIALRPICEAVDSVLVEVVAQLPAPLVACEASSSGILLTWPAVPGAAGYELNVLNGPDGSFLADTAYQIQGLDPAQAIDYEVFALSEAGCAGAVFQGSCTTLACPAYTLSLPDTLLACEGEPVALVLDILSSSSSGPFAVELQLGGFSSLLSNLQPGPNTFSFEPSASGTLQLISFTDAAFANCAFPGSLPSVEVVLQAQPQAGEAMAVALCAGQDSLLALSELLLGADSGGTWANLGPEDLGTALDPATGQLSTSGLPAGSYTLGYILSSAACESDTASLALTVNELPVAEAGGPLLLDCSLPEGQLGNPNASAAYRYTWRVLQGAGLSALDVPAPMANGGGLYELTVVDPATACSAVDTALVEAQLTTPQLFATGIGSNCPGEDQGRITVDSVADALPPLVYSLDGDNFGSSLVFSGLPNGVYTLYVQDAAGCTGQLEVALAGSGALSMVLAASPGGQQPVINQGDSLRLEVLANLPPEEIASIVWSPDLGCPDCLSITVAPSRTQVYEATLTDLNGCSVTASIEVMVLRPRRLFAPNAFSPNGDGRNDRFFVHAGPEFQRGMSLRVYDRWGGLVFEQEDFPFNEPSAGWDGVFRGEQAPTGLYLYTVEAVLGDGELFRAAGELYLVR